MRCAGSSAFVLLLGIQLALPAHGQSYRCAALPVEIEASDASLRETICSAAAQALQFLERYALRPKQTIRISVVEYPLEAKGHPIYGRYDSRSDRIQVMSLESIMGGVESPTMYEEPLDSELYRGVIAHELAHAVVQHNSRDTPPTTTAQEYLAHATQFAVLPEARRTRIIAAAKVGPWESGDVISDIYMAMALTRFAVKCYLHLTAHREPVAFVQMLLAAKWRYVGVN